MKRIITILLSILWLTSFSLSVFSQNFVLSKINENGVSNFRNILVVGNEMLAFTTGEGLYYNGSQWSGVSIPNSDQWSQVHGIKKTGGGIFASFSLSYKSYLWNNSTKAWDFYQSPIRQAWGTFVFSENKIYICTSRRWDVNNAALYSWNGADSFTELATQSGVGFNSIYAINESNVLLIGGYGDDGDLTSNKLFRYNGSSIAEIASFELDRGFAVEIHSVDSETFFIPTENGCLYRWNNNTSQLDKILTQDCGRMNIVVKDNNNIFIYSSLGVQHLNVSSGEVKPVLYNSETLYSCSDGFYEKETGKVYISSWTGIIFEIKADSTNSVQETDISAEVKLYPNPATDNIYLQLPNSSINSAKGFVYNVIGAQVMEFIITNHTENLDISSLPTGMYMLKVQTTGGRGVKKFIKK